MKRNINLLLMLATLFAACNNQQKEKAVVVAKKEIVVAKENMVSLKSDQLNAIYQQYLLLSDALINSDLAAAKEASLAIEVGAKGMGNSVTLANLASKITTAADIEKQRLLFSNLSNEMIAQVKAAGLKNGEVYVEYCPMALNDKGAFWLSNKKEIRNPYYGESMMDCGEIKETLK
ncbi:MAG: DUF3347 domain-containing protein [Pedobacter sp.]|nr:MAG: DUF3347 domain-containing protein [Pedobacter sp.]